jgi:hypothetical protein
MRAAVDMGWPLRLVTGIEELPRFEEGIAAVPEGSTAPVLCQYGRGRLDSVTLASAAGFHTRSVVAAACSADAVLRICRQDAPPGIRIAGQTGYQAGEPLAQAQAVRLDGATVTMEALGSPASGAAMIADAARTMPASRTVTLGCQPEAATGSARPGVAGAAWMRLVTADER